MANHNTAPTNVKATEDTGEVRSILSRPLTRRERVIGTIGGIVTFGLAAFGVAGPAKGMANEGAKKQPTPNEHSAPEAKVSSSTTIRENPAESTVRIAPAAISEQTPGGIVDRVVATPEQERHIKEALPRLETFYKSGRGFESFQPAEGGSPAIAGSWFEVGDKGDRVGFTVTLREDDDPYSDAIGFTLYNVTEGQRTEAKFSKGSVDGMWETSFDTPGATETDHNPAAADKFAQSVIDKF